MKLVCNTSVCFLQRNFSVMFSRLGPDIMLRLFCHLIFERRILFVSSKLFHLTGESEDDGERESIRPFLSLCLGLCAVNLSHALVSLADQSRNRAEGCSLLGRVFSFLFFRNRYRGRVSALLRSLSEFIRAFTRK